MTSPVNAFTQFGCVSGHLIWITRGNANEVIMVKRLSSDCDSSKHISFIIPNAHEDYVAVLKQHFHGCSLAAELLAGNSRTLI